MSRNDIGWIISCPCNDCNFKIHLKSASTDELKEVLSQLPEYHDQTKIKTIKADFKGTKECPMVKEVPDNA